MVLFVIFLCLLARVVVSFVCSLYHIHTLHC
jgi:hypothetical protein